MVPLIAPLSCHSPIESIFQTTPTAANCPCQNTPTLRLQKKVASHHVALAVFHANAGKCSPSRSRHTNSRSKRGTSMVSLIHPTRRNCSSPTSTAHLQTYTLHRSPQKPLSHSPTHLHRPRLSARATSVTANQRPGGCWMRMRIAICAAREPAIFVSGNATRLSVQVRKCTILVLMKEVPRFSGRSAPAAPLKA